MLLLGERALILTLVQNPGLTTAYSGHIQNATVARLAPSGYYCASADVTGQGVSLRSLLHARRKARLTMAVQ